MERLQKVLHRPLPNTKIGFCVRFFFALVEREIAARVANEKAQGCILSWSQTFMRKWN